MCACGRRRPAALDYRLRYPEQPWGTDDHTWIYYATRDKASGARINYVVQPAGAPAPSGAALLATREQVSVYVYDEQAWRRDQARDLPRTAVSPLYEPLLRRTTEFFRAYATAKQQGGSRERAKPSAP